MGSSKFLGLAVGDRSILAAQVRIAGSRREVGPAAEFTFPENVNWDAPAALGKALRQFLRQHRFSASRTVVGVPAKWLLAREKEVPPASAHVAANALRLQAERDFPADLDLVYDYAGQSDTQRSRRVLLVAMPRKHMDRLAQMADEAGLSLRAVTSSSLVLASSANGNGNGADGAGWLSVMVTADSAELVIHGQTAPRALKHVAVAGIGNGHAATALATLGSEVQRALALMPPEDGAATSRSAMLWDNVGLDEAATAALAQRGGIDLKTAADLTPLGITSLRGRLSDAPRLASAVAVAIAAHADRPAIDFLHTRLAPPKVRKINRKAILLGFAAAALVGYITWLYVGTMKAEDAFQRMQDDQKALAKKAKESDVTLQIDTAKLWFEQRTPVIGCLRELTLLFPPDRQVIATQFVFPETGRPQLVVSAPDNTWPMRLCEWLRGAKIFKDVDLPSSGDATKGVGRTRSTAFTMKFSFTGKE